MAAVGRAGRALAAATTVAVAAVITPSALPQIVVAAGEAAGVAASSASTPASAAATVMQPAWPNEEPFLGLSSVARRPGDGVLWALPERGARVLIPVSIDAHGASAHGKPLPVDGVPAHTDLESLTWLTHDTAAIGTERDVVDRAADAILLVKVDSDSQQAVVRTTLEVPYAPWGFAASRNHGIEGLCAASGELIAAVEHVVETASSGQGQGQGQASARRRSAPIARLVLDQAAAKLTRIIPYWLWLTSDDGKISGLDCRATTLASGEPAIAAVAIERHFGVSRLLYFVLPLGATATPSATEPIGIDPIDIEPTVVADLAALAPGLSVNWEGVVWDGGNEVTLLSDNQFGGQVGKTWVMRLAVALPPKN